MTIFSPSGAAVDPLSAAGAAAGMAQAALSTNTASKLKTFQYNDCIFIEMSVSFGKSNCDVAMR
jgi:hypothetical protein